MMCALHDLRRPGRACACASSACPTRSPRRSTRARPTSSSSTGYIGDFAITGEPTNLHVGVQAKGVLALRIDGLRHLRARLDAVARRQRGAEGDRRLPANRVACPSRASPRSCSTGRRSTSAGSWAATRSTRCPTTASWTSTSATCPSQDPGRAARADPRDPGRRTSRGPSSGRPRACRAEPVRASRSAQAVSRLTDGESMSVGRDGASDAIAFLRPASRRSSSARPARGHHGPEEWVSIDSLAQLPRARSWTSSRCFPSAWSADGRATRPARRARAAWRDAPRTIPRPRRLARARSRGVADRSRCGRGASPRRRCSRSTRSSNAISPSRAAGDRRSRRSRAPRPGEPADVPDPRLRRRATGQEGGLKPRSDTIMLVRAGPGHGRDRGDVAAARPEGRRSPATARTRSTPPTTIGGPRLTVKTVKQLFDARRRPINHVVNVNFGGFRRAVNASAASTSTSTGATSTTTAAATHYATIDVQPGYQKLVRPGRARLRALPPRRQRPRARRAPAGLPAPGQARRCGAER